MKTACATRRLSVTGPSRLCQRSSPSCPSTRSVKGMRLILLRLSGPGDRHRVVDSISGTIVVTVR